MDPALGAVGRVTRSNPALLHLLAGRRVCSSGSMCVAESDRRRGRVYNVNADQMAVACAAAFGAERLLLVFLTDVEGVLDGEKRTFSPRVLTAADSRQLIAMPASPRAACRRT